MRTIIICNFRFSLPLFLSLSCMIHLGIWSLSPQNQSDLEVNSRFLKLLQDNQPKTIEIQIDRWAHVSSSQPQRTPVGVKVDKKDKVDIPVEKKQPKKIKRKKRKRKKRLRSKVKARKKRLNRPKPQVAQKQVKAVPTLPPAPQPQVSQAASSQIVDLDSTPSNRNHQKATSVPAVNQASVQIKRLSKQERRGLESAYYGTLNTFLKKEKNYPRVAKRLKLEGTVWIEFTLNKKGEILKVYVLKSSGYSVLDEDALAWVQKMKKLPSPPSDLKWKKRAVRIPFNYTFQS